MKMNGKYKAALVLLLIGLACAIAAGVAGFLLRKETVAMIAGAAGTACVFTGILLAMKSGEKPEKQPPAIDEND